MVSPFVEWREIFIAGRNAVIARNVCASWPFLKVAPLFFERLQAEGHRL
jgi:hypothetical protein